MFGTTQVVPCHRTFLAWILRDFSKAEGGFGILVVAGTGEGGIGESGGVACLCFGEAKPFAFEDEFGVIDEGHAVSVGELLGAFADEVDVGAFFEDETCSVDRVAETLDTGNAACFHASAVHEEGVELNAAVGGEEAATAGVEGGIVFKNGDGGFHGVDGAAAAGEDFVTELKGAADTGLVGGRCVGGYSPRSAVNEEGGIVRGWLGCHSEHRSAWGKRKLCASERRSGEARRRACQWSRRMRGN